MYVRTYVSTYIFMCVYVCIYVFYKYIITIMLLRNRERFSNMYFCCYAVVALRITINS